MTTVIGNTVLAKINTHNYPKHLIKFVTVEMKIMAILVLKDK
jgi:hypothetical protein